MYKQIRKKKSREEEGREKKKIVSLFGKKIIEINHLIREEKNKSKGKEKEERKGKKREKKSYPPFFLIYIKKREWQSRVVEKVVESSRVVLILPPSHCEIK